MQKIATIETITNIKPHPNADKLELAQVLGYQSVVVKSEFNIGDKVIFIEPDSIIAERSRNISEFKFLEARKWRIREEKFRGCLSSGLILPAKLLAKFGPSPKLIDGTPVHEIIGVEHYEAPEKIVQASDAKGNFPFFIPKTDEPALKSNIACLPDFLEKECYITLKYDGSSCTIYNRNNDVGVCSRNLNLKEDDNNKFWREAKRLGFVNAVKDLYVKTGKNYALQAELIGPTEQGNKLGLKQNELVAFNLFNIEEKRYCNFDEFVKICETYNLPRVQVLWEGIFDKDLNWLIDMANNLVYPNGAKAEGLVLRPKVESWNYDIHRLSVKVIREDYKQK